MNQWPNRCPPVESAVRLHLDDVEEIVEAAKVVDVVGVEPGRVCVRRCGNEQVHRSRPRSTAGLDDGGGYLTIARRHCIIDRQCIEGALQYQQASQTLGAYTSLLSNQDTEMHFGQRDGADGQHAVEWLEIGSNNHAGV